MDFFVLAGIDAQGHTMTNDRRQHLEKIIKRYQEQSHALEMAIVTAFPEDKVRIKQKLEDLQQELRPYQDEYDEIIKDSQQQSRPDQEQYTTLKSSIESPKSLPKSILPPTGAMAPDSPYYVERPSDRIALEVIKAKGVTLSITGLEQVGKTSLLVRVLNAARSEGKEVVFLNFDHLSLEDMQDGRSFYRWFCSQITYYLRIEDKFEEYLQKHKILGNIPFCTHYIKNHILSNNKTLVIALDSLEKLIKAEFRSEFFGMLRSWHNARAFEPEMKMLDLVLVTSENPSKLIEDLYQSPFNVGQSIQLKNFTDSEAIILNNRYDSPVNDSDVQKLPKKPYELQQALYQIKYEQKTVDDLSKEPEPHEEPEPHPRIYKTAGLVEMDQYVSRKADQQLLNLCQKGDYAYVLTSRQVGKSSLVFHTAEKLKKLEIPVIPVIIDLQGMGATPTQEQWYLGFLLKVVERLNLEIDLLPWWDQNCQLGMTDRFTRFFAEILKSVTKRIVVFVDEIDTTLRLDYTDDFFIAIRSFYTERPNNPNFKRLSFVLVGVATPAELIQDEKRTPFNIATEVELTDFTPDEAKPLASGLELGEQKNNELFDMILSWTGGHPYLTQKLCFLVKKKLKEYPNKDSSVVEIVVKEEFLTDKKSNRDVHFQGIENMLTKRYPDNALGMLYVYGKIWKGNQISDDTGSEVKRYLKLSGVVKAEGKYLVVRNKIYRDFFDQEWINLSQLLVDRPYAEAVASWSQSGNIDQSKLLLFEECDKGYQWYRDQRERTQLTRIDHDFFDASRQFNEQTQIYLDGFLNESKKNIVAEIMKWTNGNPKLNTIIFKQVKTKQIGISSDTKKVNLLIKDLITKNCENGDKGIFKLIFVNVSQGLKSVEVDTFQLLLTYRGILDGDSHDCMIENDNSYKQGLQAIDLVIKSGDRLKVANKIYAEIFNQTWVDQQLRSSSLRPYAKQFVQWLISEGRDHRHLLRGTMLVKAEMQFANDGIHRKERQFLWDSKCLQ